MTTTKQDKQTALRAKAQDIISRASTRVILYQPFFSTIMLRKKIELSEQVATAAVSERGNIYINPKFAASQTVPQMAGLICHEVLHYASGHFKRRQQRDLVVWNYATDAWINDTLRRCQIELPDGGVDEPGSADSTPEDIYRKLMEDLERERKQQQQSGEETNGVGSSGSQSPGKGGKSASHRIGEHTLEGDLSQAPEEPLSAAETEVADAVRKADVAQAAALARQRGNLPGPLRQFVETVIASKVPWYEALAAYLTELVCDERSYARPAKRYMPSVYMPSVSPDSGRLGEVVIQFDISGSVSPMETSQFIGHVRAILEQVPPTKLHVLYTDTKVRRHDVFETVGEVQLHAVSAGGTDMRAGLEYCSANSIEPDLFITLTDGDTPYPTRAPSYPLVWVISGKVTAPIGKTIHYDATC